VDLVQRRRNGAGAFSGIATDVYTRFYGVGTGRLFAASAGGATAPTDENRYDPAGNTITAMRQPSVRTPYKMCVVELTRKTCREDISALLLDYTTSFYDADNRLRVADRRGCLTSTPSSTTRSSAIRSALRRTRRAAPPRSTATTRWPAGAGAHPAGLLRRALPALNAAHGVGWRPAPVRGGRPGSDLGDLGADGA
jgi:hypothetical protein